MTLASEEKGLRFDIIINSINFFGKKSLIVFMFEYLEKEPEILEKIKNLNEESFIYYFNDWILKYFQILELYVVRM